MPALENKRYEIFAQGVAKGMSEIDAYVHAGGANQRATASRIANRPEVKARIEEISRQAIADQQKSTMLTIEWWKSQLMDTMKLAVDRGDLSAQRALLETAGKHLGSFELDKVSYSGSIKDRAIAKDASSDEATRAYKELIASSSNVVKLAKG